MYQKRLGDMASYVNGYAFKPEQRGKVGLPIIRIQDLTGNIYDLGFYDGDYPKKVEINDGDVLISWSASLGVYEWSRGKALLNQHIFKVVFDKLTVDKKFFMYAVQYKLEEMESKTHGATMKHITKKDFDNTVIPFPTIVEQERISNTLNKLHTIIDSKKFQLEKLDNLIKARFVEMFKDEDPVFAFDDVLIDDTKNGFKLDSSNYSNLGKIAIVDQGQKRICGYINAVDGKAPWSKEAIIFGDHTEMFKYINFPFYLGADGTKLLSPKNGWNTRFLYHYLDINYHKRLGYMRHFKYLKEMSFIKPDLDRQEEFCMFCTQVDKSKFTLQNNIISLMNLWYNINQYVCERTYGEA